MPKKLSVVTVVLLAAATALISIVAGCQRTGRAIGDTRTLTPAASASLASGPQEGTSASDGPVNSVPAGSNQATPPATDAASIPGGAVVGSLTDVRTLEPLAGVELFLAPIEGTHDFPVAVLNRAEHPRAATGPDGAFEFPTVEAGRYVVIVGAEGTGGMIEDTTTGATLVVRVEDGQVVDLGSIAIERP